MDEIVCEEKEGEISCQIKEDLEDTVSCDVRQEFNGDEIGEDKVICEYKERIDLGGLVEDAEEEVDDNMNEIKFPSKSIDQVEKLNQKFDNTLKAIDKALNEDVKS